MKRSPSRKPTGSAQPRWSSCWGGAPATAGWCRTGRRSAAPRPTTKPDGVANLTYKDLALALSIAHSRGLALPGTGLTAQLVAEPYLSAAAYAEAAAAKADAGEQ